MCCVKLAATQHDNGADKVSQVSIGTKDFQTLHLNQRATKEDEKELQVFEGQPLQTLEGCIKSATVEVEDNASSKTCRMSKEESKENLDQDLGSEVNVEQEISSIERPKLTMILSLCGLLLRGCWQKSKRMKSLKFQHEYIVLRP